MPQLLKNIPQIISSLVKGFANYYKKLGEVGTNLIKGLWNGMKDMGTWLWNKVQSLLGGLTDKIKNFFGIHSPSRLFRDEIGQYLGLGLGEGFEDSLSAVYKDMQKAVDYQNAKLTSNLTTSNQIRFINEDNRQATLNSIDNNREINVNSTIELDGKIVANTVNKVNAKQKLQYGLA